MRTARLLPVSSSMHCSWGSVPAQGGVCTCPGVYLPRESTCLGVYLPRGSTCLGCTCLGGGVNAFRGYLTWGCTCQGGCTFPGVTCPGGSGGCTCPGGYLHRYFPPVNRMTDRCKNITLPQTWFVGGNNRPGCQIEKEGLRKTHKQGKTSGHYDQGLMKSKCQDMPKFFI